MAKNNHDEEKNIISGDGQIHAFPEEGLSADFVDLEYEKATERMKQALAEEAGAKDEKAHAAAVHEIKLRQLYWAEIEALRSRREAARVASLRYPRAVMVAMDSLDTPRERMKQALAEEAGAKDEKAHAAAVHKTKLRQLYWAEIEALREAARVASLRYPRAVMVAMDSLDTPRVVRGFALPIFSLADSVFYGAFLEGNPVEPVGSAVDLDDRNVVTPLDDAEECSELIVRMREGVLRC